MHDGSHGDGCFGCRIKSVQFGPSVFATRTKRVGRPVENKNSWERGIATNSRGQAILDPNTLQPIPIKTWSERRHEFEQARHQMRQTTDAVTKE